jgi:hypothetical protein
MSVELFGISNKYVVMDVELAIIRPLIDHLTRCHQHNFVVNMDYTPPRLILSPMAVKCASRFIKGDT